MGGDAMVRYGRILLRFWKNSLIREMTFRGHFFVQVVGEVLWIAMILMFVRVIYTQTSSIQGWSEHQYLFLTGTHLLVKSLFETFFFGNCWRVSHLVQTGDLDFVLLRPASAQFLLSVEKVDFTALANVPVAAGICIWSASEAGVSVTVGRVALYLLVLGFSVTLLYSLLFTFAMTSVWFVRQTGLQSMWFYVVSLARYPSEIYQRFAGGVLWFVLVFVIPVLLVSNVPANVIVRELDMRFVGYLGLMAFVMLYLSTVMFRFSMRWYRSASS